MEVIALDSDGGGGGGGSGGGANQESHAAGMTQKVALPELEQSNGEQMLDVKRIALVWRGGGIKRRECRESRCGAFLKSHAQSHHERATARHARGW